MPSTKITERLQNGEVLVMDGGTGSELQRRGVSVLEGVDQRLLAWSASANIMAPDVVQQVHQDYLRVGANIILSNNFWTTPTRLALIGETHKWREYAQAAAGHAIKARNKINPEAYVAGAMSTPSLQGHNLTHDQDKWLVRYLLGDRSPSATSAMMTLKQGVSKAAVKIDAVPDIERLGQKAYHDEYADHARLLADAGVDLILAEYVGTIPDAVGAVDACSDSGLPVFLGLRHIGPDGTLHYGDTIKELVSALEGYHVDGILLMCSNPEAISAGLPLLRASFDGPIGAYPNLGYNPTGPVANRSHLTNQKASSGPDIFQTSEYPPTKVAEFAVQWKEMGAQLIGGCCASGPEHVLSISEALK